MVCEECASDMVVVEEAATYTGSFGEVEHPAVIEHHHCGAAGCRRVDHLARRYQESAWVRAVWGLPAGRGGLF